MEYFKGGVSSFPWRSEDDSVCWPQEAEPNTVILIYQHLHRLNTMPPDSSLTQSKNKLFVSWDGACSRGWVGLEAKVYLLGMGGPGSRIWALGLAVGVRMHLLCYLVGKQSTALPPYTVIT